MRYLSVFVFCIAMPSAVQAAEMHSWDIWQTEQHHQCPDRHIEFISGYDYDDLIKSFAHYGCQHYACREAA